VEVSLARDTVEICTVVNTFGAMKHSWKCTRICGTTNISTTVIPSKLRIAGSVELVQPSKIANDWKTSGFDLFGYGSYVSS